MTLRQSAALAGLFCAAVGFSASATTVQFQTVMGDFEVNLFDQTTPKTVENFLAYVNEDAYKNTIVHRVERNFVVQGGGYRYEDKLPLVMAAQKPSVANEPVYSNLRGTIAMAKLGSQPNSATNQWFINLSDKNADNLDTQNGGFTVFGQVMGNGMAIVDAIAALELYTLSAFKGFPLRNYSEDDAKAEKPIGGDQLVMIQNIVVLNADPTTAAALNPIKNTKLTKAPEEKPKKSGGGSAPWLICLLGGLGLARMWRR
jgi:peptidyl-prolyl cis-trans isomerase A (cyclophilin A)